MDNLISDYELTLSEEIEALAKQNKLPDIPDILDIYDISELYKPNANQKRGILRSIIFEAYRCGELIAKKGLRSIRL